MPKKLEKYLSKNLFRGCRIRVRIQWHWLEWLLFWREWRHFHMCRGSTPVRLVKKLKTNDMKRKVQCCLGLPLSRENLSSTTMNTSTSPARKRHLWYETMTVMLFKVFCPPTMTLKTIMSMKKQQNCYVAELSIQMHNFNVPVQYAVNTAN